jgi:hypothetical protein
MLGMPLGQAGLEHGAVQLAQQIDLVSGLPGQALAAVADLVEQRAERREAACRGWDSRARPR